MSVVVVALQPMITDKACYVHISNSVILPRCEQLHHVLAHSKVWATGHSFHWNISVPAAHICWLLNGIAWWLCMRCIIMN